MVAATAPVEKTSAAKKAVICFMVRYSKVKNKLSEGEERLALQLRAYGIPFKREYRFHPKRRWRFDFLIGDRLAVEVEGAPGVGRHTTAKGFTADCEKYNAATLQGYQLLRFTPKHIKRGTAIDLIRSALVK